MFGTEDYRKRKLQEAYGKGVEKARQTGALEDFMDAMATLVLPDSMGTEEYQSYKQGYHDYMSGKIKRQASASTKLEKPIALDASEKAWYGLCNTSEFIPEEIVSYYRDRLFANGHQVAFVIGLSDFTEHLCPQCGAQGQFKIHFLGRLNHPRACGWEGYMKTGSYIGHQLAQVFHTGIRAGGAMHNDAKKKPNSNGAWIYGVLGFLFVAMFRIMVAVVLIPLHCIAALFQPRQSTADIATRVIALVTIITGIGIGVYEIQQASKPQFPVSQRFYPSGPAPASRMVQAAPRPLPNNFRTPTSYEPAVRSTFSETFTTPPDFSSNWNYFIGSGNPSVRYGQGQLQVQAPVSGGSARFVAKSSFSADVDVTFTYNHQGFGRTTVGLWSLDLNDWQVWADLDTNDTACLYLNSRGQPTAPLCPSTSYMNRTLALRIVVVGYQVTFYDDHSALGSLPFSPVGPYAPVIAVGSVNWKGGDNITTFYSVIANGSAPAPDRTNHSAQPSFNCARARTAVERLLCRDSRLAGLEVGMVSAYNQAMSRLSSDGQLALKRDHLSWFKNYSRTCNRSADDDDRANCIANFLSVHTDELRAR